MRLRLGQQWSEEITLLAILGQEGEELFQLKVEPRPVDCHQCLGTTLSEETLKHTRTCTGICSHNYRQIMIHTQKSTTEYVTESIINSVV